MWFKALLIGLLIGLVFVAISISAQPSSEDQELILQKLDEVVENQKTMLNYLKFIKNKAA